MVIEPGLRGPLHGPGVIDEPARKRDETGAYCSGVIGEVGEEPEVTPVRPQSCLTGVGEPGATDHQTTVLVHALSHLGFTVRGVIDVGPGIFVDGGNGVGDASTPTRASGWPQLPRLALAG